MSSMACIVCVITMRYSGAAARSSSSPGVMLEEPAGGHGDGDAGPGRNAEEPVGSWAKDDGAGGEGHREPVAGLPPHGVGDSAVRDPSGRIDSPDGVQHGRLARQAGEVAERHRARRLRCPAQGGQGQGLDDLLRGGCVVLHAVTVHRSSLLADCLPRVAWSLIGGLQPRIRRIGLLRMRGLPRASCGDLLAGNAQPVIYSRPVMPDASARICGLAWSGGI